MHGIESCQAASNPVIAFVEPDPVVTTAHPTFPDTFEYETAAKDAHCS